MDYSTMLQNLKRQLRVDYDDEDEKLLGLLKAAEAFTVKSTGRTRGSLLDEGSEVTVLVTEDGGSVFMTEDGGGFFELDRDDGDYPEPIVQAIVMLAGHWYENPTAMVGGSMRDNPYGFWTLIAPYSVL